MFGRVPGTRPNITEPHSERSTRVPFCIATGADGMERMDIDALASHILGSGGVRGSRGALGRKTFVFRRGGSGGEGLAVALQKVREQEL